MPLFQSFRALTGTALLLMGSFISLTACETETVDPGNPTTTDPGTDTNPGSGSAGKAGYLIGQVTDPQGRPLPRATIFTDNTVFKGRGAEVNTGTDGTCQVQLVKDLGQCPFGFV